MLAFANVIVYNYQYMLDPKARRPPTTLPACSLLQGARRCALWLRRAVHPGRQLTTRESKEQCRPRVSLPFLSCSRLQALPLFLSRLRSKLPVTVLRV